MCMRELLPQALDCSDICNQPKPVVCALMMTENDEQHFCITFCQKLGHLCSETYNMIPKIFGKEKTGHTQVKEWFKWDKHQSIVMNVQGGPP